MVNGLGVLGWGVGGIEAEAAMLGQPLYMVTPQVVGFRLTGRLREGVTATDLVLTVTQQLRKKGVVEKFVEFYGPGPGRDVAGGPRHHREHGAGIRRHLRLLPGGRGDARSTCGARAATEAWWTSSSGTPRSRASSAPRRRPDPLFTETLELDLGTVEPSLAGPKRPQDRVPLSRMKDAFRQALTAPVKERGFGLDGDDLRRRASVEVRGGRPSWATARW